MIGEKVMKRIKLTQEQYALVDNEDYEKVNQYKWFAMKTKYDGFTARRNDSRKNNNGRQVPIFMQHFIMDFKPSKKKVMDHINRDTLDNRKQNLRICTYSQNNMNRKSSKNKINKFKGVFKNKGRGKKWTAAIRKNKKLFALGYFNSEIEGAKAYNKAAFRLFGKFALLNKI